MLFAVRNFVLLLTFLLLSFANIVTPSPQAGPAGPPPQVPAAPPPSSSPPPAAAVQQTYTGPVIVIDPAHGGTDTGARGQGGVIEKDIVLQFARVTRGELVRQGYRVVLTRDDDSNPSYDDRAAMANSYRDAIFVSLHISSTGAPGTSRAYYYQFWKPLPPASPAGGFCRRPAIGACRAYLASSPTGLCRGMKRSVPIVDQSQRLADQLQGQLASVFPRFAAGIRRGGSARIAFGRGARGRYRSLKRLGRRCEIAHRSRRPARRFDRQRNSGISSGELDRGEIMARKWKIAIGILAVAVVVGLLVFAVCASEFAGSRNRRTKRSRRAAKCWRPPITTPTDVNATAKIFWAAGPDKVAPVEFSCRFPPIPRSVPSKCYMR